MTSDKASPAPAPKTPLAEALAKLDAVMRPKGGTSTDPDRRRLSARLSDLARCKDEELDGFARRHLPGQGVPGAALRDARELLLALARALGPEEGSPESLEALSKVRGALDDRLEQAREERSAREKSEAEALEVEAAVAKAAEVEASKPPPIETPTFSRPMDPTFSAPVEGPIRGAAAEDVSAHTPVEHASPIPAAAPPEFLISDETTALPALSETPVSTLPLGAVHPARLPFVLKTGASSIPVSGASAPAEKASPAPVVDDPDEEEEDMQGRTLKLRAVTLPRPAMPFVAPEGASARPADRRPARPESLELHSGRDREETVVHDGGKHARAGKVPVSALPFLEVGQKRAPGPAAPADKALPFRAVEAATVPVAAPADEPTSEPIDLEEDGIFDEETTVATPALVLGGPESARAPSVIPPPPARARAASPSVVPPPPAPARAASPSVVPPPPAPARAAPARAAA
ncbi:MAG: hypothetical protein R3F14_15565, partial [Polyangiaceae bacterium]